MESTLSLKRDDLIQEVADFLGWNPTDMETELSRIVNSGQRQFYFPVPTEGGAAHNWSFLRPVVTLTLLEDESVVMLPDDFGGFEGQITMSSDESNSFCPINVIGVGALYAKTNAFPDSSGRPECVCLEPLKEMSANTGQRWQLKFFPTADQDYSVQFQYYILPSALSGTRPYCYGGMAHAETILESCLSIAEERRDDMQGVHKQKWMERLLASIALDKRFKAQHFGYNGDYSDGVAMDYRGMHGIGINQVTFAGVEYP